jgi:predicted homoserine dehydrogenase-like protein
MYKPYHLIGLELGISVASVALRREPTGAPLTFFGERAWHADVVATAKRDLKAGETLDGEGGYTVFGKLMRAQQSLATRGLPLGLAHGLKLLRDVPCGATLSMDDVEAMPASAALQMRDELAALL